MGGQKCFLQTFYSCSSQRGVSWFVKGRWLWIMIICYEWLTEWVIVVDSESKNEFCQDQTQQRNLKDKLSKRFSFQFAYDQLDHWNKAWQRCCWYKAVEWIAGWTSSQENNMAAAAAECIVIHISSAFLKHETFLWLLMYTSDQSGPQNKDFSQDGLLNIPGGLSHQHLWGSSLRGSNICKGLYIYRQFPNHTHVHVQSIIFYLFCLR